MVARTEFWFGFGKIAACGFDDGIVLLAVGCAVLVDLHLARALCGDIVAAEDQYGAFR